MAYYSSNGVDREVEQYLPAWGYACDVGANDGASTSNSLCFEQMGWYVLCVEPNPNFAEEARKHRKLWRQVAVSDKNGEALFTQFGPHPWGGSGLKDLLNLRASYPRDHEVQTMVRTRTLDTLLEEAGFPRLDYLTVDCEGCEPEVLAGFTVERWKPRVMVFENNKVRSPFSIPGYTHIGTREVDEVYLRQIPS